MATIIIEDGTGKTNANSYATESNLSTYAADRGITIAGTNSQLLITAMDYIESLDFTGVKNTKEQVLQWPRYGVYIDGYSFDNDAIPQLLIDAQIEVALAVDASNDPLSTVDRATKMEKLDGLEVEYMDNSSDAAILRKVNAKLKKLLRASKYSVVRA